jgi:hypothetical protein
MTLELKRTTDICMYMEKTIPVETVPGMGGGREKEEWWRG